MRIGHPLTAIGAVVAAILIAILIAGCSSTHAPDLKTGASAEVDRPAVALDPGVDHVHAAVFHGGHLLLGTHSGLVEVDPATGLTKARGTAQDDFMALAAAGSSLIASGHPGPGSGLPDPLGLQRSEDGGLTWQGVSLSGQVDFHGLATDGSSIAGIGTEDGVLISDDGGSNWQASGVNAAISLAWFQGELWIASEDGLRIWSNGSIREAPASTQSLMVLATAGDGTALWAVARNGSVWRSLDGSTWQERGAVTALEALAATTETAYAVTARSITVIPGEDGLSPMSQPAPIP